MANKNERSVGDRAVSTGIGAGAASLGMGLTTPSAKRYPAELLKFFQQQGVDPKKIASGVRNRNLLAGALGGGLTVAGAELGGMLGDDSAAARGLGGAIGGATGGAAAIGSMGGGPALLKTLMQNGMSRKKAIAMLFGMGSGLGAAYGGGVGAMGGVGEEI